MPWVMAAERSMVDANGGEPETYRDGCPPRPAINSGVGLESLQLAANLIDGAVQLQHPIPQRPFGDRVRIVGLASGRVRSAGAILSAAITTAETLGA
jgi:hypothetical protein